MATKKYCIFACGGHGTRMGDSIPKQFLRIGEKTILQLSIEKILGAVPEIEIIVVLPQEFIRFWQEECAQRGLVCHQILVGGGITRFHSVRNALDKVVEEDAVVAVHDGVRPLCSEELAARLYEEAQAYGTAVPVVPLVDTIKVLRRCQDGSLEQMDGATADRSVLFGAQTPQVFGAKLLKAAYKLPYDTAFTDDASVVEAAGEKVRYVEGERYNIKITTPEDLLFARRLLL